MTAEAGRPVLLRPAFALLWLSETVLDLGSALMSFALGVWIFQRTGSAEQFSQAVLWSALPALLMTPFAGALADRFDRRRVIAGCDAASVLTIATLAALLWRGRLEPAHLYLFNAAGAVINALRTPAYRAAVSQIVPRERMTQASGLVGMSQAVLQIVAPLAAGYVMGAAGLEGVVSLDLLLVGGGALAALGALARARHAVRGGADAGLPFWRSSRDGFARALGHFRRTPPLAGLAAYTVLQESLLVLAVAMMTPLVLSFRSSDALGLILACGALGGLAGSLLLVARPIERRLMAWLLAADAALALFVLLAGFGTSTAWWCACAFGALFAGSASGACASALWMRKTPAGQRGSIFAVLGALDLAATCLVLLGGGHLGERVFEPALAAGGDWAGTVGAWLGTGRGQGLRFLFIVSGAAGCLISLLALLHPRLRQLDSRVPDHPETPAGPLPAHAAAT
ncbi:MFS transporter [Chitinimonas koreensis]|uniref:MFS transporter n=1 Tax=Chitinimonas koreensis TaxID=356302 RepID=UPI00041C6D3A|nr:MFS transporter [Chitinimonas koreensis]QNM97393.1 MFS transporter [Chitinimonas koreensis]